MTKRFNKLISLVLTFMISLSMCCIGNISVSATQTRTEYFSKNYTLTGNWRDDIVAVANAQYQKTQSNLGYTEAWCANFVCDCAKLAGIPNFPHYGSCTGLIPKLQSWGGTWYSYSSSYIPQKGDLVFFSTSSNTDTDSDHVGIVYSSGFNADGSVNTIEGNTSGVSKSCVNIKKRTISKSSISYLYIKGYISLTPNSANNNYDSSNPDNYSFPTRDIYYNSSNVMTGSDVAWIQAVLYQLGYSINIDGSFGPASKTVVQQFQSDYGLEVDGSVGPATREKLYNLWTSKSFEACDLGTDFYAYITNTAYWLYLSNDSHNVSARSATYLTEQIWKFEKQSDGSYLIKSSKDDSCLDVADAIAQNSTNVQTCAYNGCDAQKWYFINAGDNRYIIKSKLGNYVLDLAGGANVSGTNIQIYEPNGTDAQYFSVHRYEPPTTTNINVEVDGTSVRVNWDIVNGCARYDVYLLQSPWSWNDIKYSKQIDFSMNYCEFNNVTPGNYAAFVVTKPNDNSKQSAWVDFTVNCDDLKPDNQIVYNDHIYTLYNDTLTWDEAKAQCEAMGGHLVTVTSAEEQTIIENLVKDQFCKWYFMGATNIENGTDYEWVTGEKFEYTNWKNDSLNNSNEHYMMATTNLNGGWQDTVVDGYGCLVGFICEVETDSIKAVKESVFNGHKYELYDEVLTWEDAKVFAELKGGHLVTVTSAEEKQFINGLLQSGSQPYYWLGGTGDNISGFNWLNGEEFSYSNWANNEPNNSNNIENYIMQYKNSSEWNDSTNYQYLTGFVIEYGDNTLSGDTNLDGTVSVDDVTYLQMHLARYTDSEGNALIDEVDESVLAIADVDGDGALTISDATALQMSLAGY